MSFVFDKKNHLFFFTYSSKTYKNFTLHLKLEKFLLLGYTPFIEKINDRSVNPKSIQIDKKPLLEQSVYKKINSYIPKIVKFYKYINSILGFRIKKEILNLN